jgi:hypothetical protein
VARLSREAAERARQIFRKSDEALGQWLADIERRAIEAAACEVAGIEAIYTGINALAEPPASTLARRLVQRLTDGLLDDVIRFDDDAPWHLARWLALRGDFARAGLAMRASKDGAAVAAYDADKARTEKMRATKRDRQAQRLARWSKIGTTIRQSEAGCRKGNLALAREIALKTHDSVHSIRLAIPMLRLDAASWPKPVKPRSLQKTNRKPRTFGTLRR